MLVDFGRIDENSFLSTSIRLTKEDNSIPGCSKLSIKEMTR